MARSVRHRAAPERREPMLQAFLELGQRGPARIRARSLSCSCGSAFRSTPQTGQSPAQSGRQRILSGSASTSPSRAQAERSSRLSVDVRRRQLLGAARALRLVLAEREVARRGRRRRGSGSTARAAARGSAARTPCRSTPASPSAPRARSRARRDSAGRPARSARSRPPARRGATRRTAAGTSSDPAWSLRSA